MGSKYKPIAFTLIEEGRLARSLDEQITESTKKLLAHVKKYGRDATKKAKAEITLKVSVQYDGTDDETYSIKGAISSKLPGRPIHNTLAIHETEQDGEETLFVRSSGSDGDSPRQMKLATDDGEAIDPKTGEVIPPKNPKKKEN